MKKFLLFIGVLLLLIILLSCGTEQPEPSSAVGCQSGIIDGNRIFIRCTTMDGFLAGDNIDAGGLSKSEWSKYSNIKWELCDNCK